MGKNVEVQDGGMRNGVSEEEEMRKISSVGGVVVGGDQLRYCDSKNGKVAARVHVWFVLGESGVEEGIVKDMYWRKEVAWEIVRSLNDSGRGWTHGSTRIFIYEE